MTIKTCMSYLIQVFLLYRKERSIKQNPLGGSQGLPQRSGGTAPEKKMLPGGSPPQAEYPAKPDTFLSYSKERPIR